MENYKNDFIYLLSCFLNEDKPEKREYSWQEIYHIADINDVAPIVFFEISKLNNENTPKGEILQYYKKQFATAISRYEMRLNAVDTVNSILSSNEIPHIFVKGAEISKYYPVAELRTSGDIDIVVEKDLFEKAVDILINSKNIEKRSYVTDTFTFSLWGYTVEMHNNADVFSNYFDNIFSKADLVEDFRYSLSDYSSLLYAFCHLVKHLSYRGAGIRMLMDLDVLIRSIEDFDENYFISLCNEISLEKCAKALLSLLKYWFNTPVSAFCDFEKNSELLERLSYVFIDGGSFGYEKNCVPVKYISKNAQQGRLSFFERVKVLLNMAFPSKEYLKKCYPYYNKNKHLYLLAVFNRLFDSVFKKRKQAKNSFSQVLFDSNELLSLNEILNELDIK